VSVLVSCCVCISELLCMCVCVFVYYRVLFVCVGYTTEICILTAVPAGII